MPPLLLIRLVEECLAAGAFLEGQRQRGEALDEAIGRAKLASAGLAAHLDSVQHPGAKPLIDAVRNYLAAEAVFEGNAEHAPSPAKAFEELHKTREALDVQVHAYHLAQGTTLKEPAAPGAGPRSLRPRVLIAIDGSTPSTWAIHYGGQLADAVGAHVMLLHVGEPVTAEGHALVFATVQLREEQRELHRQWRDLLEGAKHALPRRVRSETMLRDGPPAREIIHVARTWEADLIVMGTRGRGRLAQFLLGSVAEAVIRGASCPVLTVGHAPPQRPFHRHPHHGTANAAGG